MSRATALAEAALAAVPAVSLSRFAAAWASATFDSISARIRAAVSSLSLRASALAMATFCSTSLRTCSRASALSLLACSLASTTRFSISALMSFWIFSAFSSIVFLAFSISCLACPAASSAASSSFSTIFRRPGRRNVCFSPPCPARWKTHFVRVDVVSPAVGAAAVAGSPCSRGNSSRADAGEGLSAFALGGPPI